MPGDYWCAPRLQTILSGNNPLLPRGASGDQDFYETFNHVSIGGPVVHPPSLSAFQLADNIVLPPPQKPAFAEVALRDVGRRDEFG